LAFAVAALGPSVAHAATAARPVYRPAPPVYTPSPPKEKSKPTTETPPSTGTEGGIASRPRIATRPARRTRKHMARFVFVHGDRFECALDSATYRRCGAVFTRFVSTGSHVLRVRPAGGGPVASYRWRVLRRR